MADTHPLVTIFGVFIGLSLFGFMGVIFGPLMLEMFVFCVNCLQRRSTSTGRRTSSCSSPSRIFRHSPPGASGRGALRKVTVSGVFVKNPVKWLEFQIVYYLCYWNNGKSGNKNRLIKNITMAKSQNQRPYVARRTAVLVCDARMSETLSRPLPAALLQRCNFTMRWRSGAVPYPTR